MLKSKLKIASEKTMRAESKALVESVYRACSFHLLCKGWSVEVQNVPLPDLWQKISDMLSCNDDPERR